MVHHYLALLGLAAIATAGPLSLRNYETSQNASRTFKEIPTTPDLKWTPCYNNFTCVNLEVPLDYEDEEAGITNIAFVRWENPKQPAKGDIILNPGGPGGSGVSFLIGRRLPQFIEYLARESYNLVGMDPRGVNNSGPGIDCFQGMPAVRDYYATDFHLMFEPRSEDMQKRVFASAGALGTFCTARLNDTAKYANTAASARDMLQYVELLAESQDKPREEAQLNYYGVSWGSVLGTTFASLFPDRIGRMIIDGVMDTPDYHYGGWISGITQGDDALYGFFKQCFEAGPKCAFYRNDTKSADDLKDRFDALIAEVIESPIEVGNPTNVMFPTFITDVDILHFLLRRLFNPFETFPTIAAQLALLEQRNASTFAMQHAIKGIQLPTDSDKISPEYDLAITKFIIGCNDNAQRFKIETVDKWIEYMNTIAATSKYFGAGWARAMILQCRNMNFTPPDNQIVKDFKKNVKTSHPILFATNTIDPVTSEARKMSGYFADSRILWQNAIGHGIFVSPSECTAKHTSRYMETGEMPPTDTICEADIQPFDLVDAVAKRDVMPRMYEGSPAAY